MTVKELLKKRSWGKDINRIVKNLCGKKIAEGQYRLVYELKGNKNYVVKIEKFPDKGYFANVTEWKNWMNNKDWKLLGKWLAPCVMINQTGQVLIQKRVKQKEEAKYPKKIPNVFVDTKYANAGWIGKQFVFCDYPFFVQTSLKLKKAKWWGENDSNYTKV
jgi:hypothetical protein